MRPHIVKKKTVSNTESTSDHLSCLLENGTHLCVKVDFITIFGLYIVRLYLAEAVWDVFWIFHAVRAITHSEFIAVRFLVNNHLDFVSAKKWQTTSNRGGDWAPPHRPHTLMTNDILFGWLDGEKSLSKYYVKCSLKNAHRGLHAVLFENEIIKSKRCTRVKTWAQHAWHDTQIAFEISETFVQTHTFCYVFTKIFRDWFSQFFYEHEVFKAIIITVYS